MSQYVLYDEANNVLFADYTNMTVSKRVFDQVFLDVKELTAKLPKKIYLLTCFQNTKVDPDVQNEWGRYTQEFMEYVSGIVRYAATDVLTNITIRSNAVRYHTQGSNSYIYPTKQAALQAIRKLEQEQKK